MSGDRTLTTTSSKGGRFPRRARTAAADDLSSTLKLELDAALARCKELRADDKFVCSLTNDLVARFEAMQRLAQEEMLSQDQRLSIHASMLYHVQVMKNLSRIFAEQNKH